MPEENKLLEGEQEKNSDVFKAHDSWLKKFFPLLLAILVIAVFVIITFAYAGKKEKEVPKIEPPTTKKGKIFSVGSEWTYRYGESSTLTVKIEEEKKVNSQNVFVYSATSSEGGNPMKLLEKHDEKGLFIVGAETKDASVTFTPPIVSFKYPLKVGEEWKTTYTRSDQAQIKFVSEAKVMDYKKIKVPAGTFECYRIDHKTYMENAPENVAFSTDWYSPKVGIVMQISKAPHGGVIIKELVNYKIKEAKEKH